MFKYFLILERLRLLSVRQEFKAKKNQDYKNDYKFKMQKLFF